MRVFSVVTVSYLYQAEVLFASLRRVHPEFRLALILADCSGAMLMTIRANINPDVEIFCCEDLDIKFVNIMREYYDPLEFCSALKVIGMKYFLEVEEKCLFLDPDILVLERFDRALSDVNTEISMCSHSFSPYPDDGQLPNDLELCLTGHINGGILFAKRVTKGTQALDWLASKATFQWFVAPQYGMYADQQWLSALSYFYSDSVTLIRDKGINVAYWNLHERPLRMVNENTINVCNETSLKLFHFSGFSSLSPNLTIHSTRTFDFETERALGSLIKSYRNNLNQALQKYEGLSGDLGFSKLSLKTKLKLAERHWGRVANPTSEAFFNMASKRILQKVHQVLRW